jgi:hypothetical protein
VKQWRWLDHKKIQAWVCRTCGAAPLLHPKQSSFFLQRAQTWSLQCCSTTKQAEQGKNFKHHTVHGCNAADLCLPYTHTQNPQDNTIALRRAPRAFEMRIENCLQATSVDTKSVNLVKVAILVKFGEIWELVKVGGIE